MTLASLLNFLALFPSPVKWEDAVVAVRVEYVRGKLAGVWHAIRNQYMVAIVFISWA